MKLEITNEERKFREYAREWLSENVPQEHRPPRGSEMIDFDKQWQRSQYKAGWAGLAWPKEFGGGGLSQDLLLIWIEEYARAKAPDASNSLFIGLNHAGPTLINCGSEEQKDQHLRNILSGENVWCQGFSEPNAGSDLAALRTRGVLENDHLLVTGQKIWTSYGQYAQYQELLVRTDPKAPKHKGISWVICDMRAPGIDIRPIKDISGGATFCEVFYDEVKIPVENIVGGLNNGWRTAMSTLGFERGTASMAHQIELSRLVEELIEWARSNPLPGQHRYAIQDDEIRRRLASARSSVAGLKALTMLGVSRSRTRAIPGAEGSITRLYFTELVQQIYRLAIDLLGIHAIQLPGPQHWPIRYLHELRQPIAGGTSEIQRNIIGERILGLPR